MWPEVGLQLFIWPLTFRKDRVDVRLRNSSCSWGFVATPDHLINFIDCILFFLFSSSDVFRFELKRWNVVMMEKLTILKQTPGWTSTKSESQSCTNWSCMTSQVMWLTLHIPKNLKVDWNQFLFRHDEAKAAEYQNTEQQHGAAIFILNPLPERLPATAFTIKASKIRILLWKLQKPDRSERRDENLEEKNSLSFKQTNILRKKYFRLGRARKYPPSPAGSNSVSSDL